VITLTYHQDPGHGWIETTMRELVRVGLTDAVSRFSYIDRSVSEDPLDAIVYLEEDCDATLFLSLLRTTEAVKLRNVYSEVTGIRNLPAYDASIFSGVIAH
jgi:hypothetical protein